MKLFLDTGDIEEIKAGYDLGIIDGVTVNPLMLNKKWGGKTKTFINEFSKFKKSDPLIVSLSSSDPEDMLREAEELKSYYNNIIIKLCMIEEDLHVLKDLKKKDIKTHISLIFSLNQAFIAAKSGASLISPFLGRSDDMGGDGAILLEDIIKMIEQYEFKTEVMAASLRNPRHAAQAIMMGTPIITLPLKVIKKMLYHPATEAGEKEFKNALK